MTSSKRLYYDRFIKTIIHQECLSNATLQSCDLQIRGRREPRAAEVESIRSLGSHEEITAAVKRAVPARPVLAAVMTAPHCLMTKSVGVIMGPATLTALSFIYYKTKLHKKFK